MYENWVSREETSEFLEWYEDHMYHEDSSGQMEVDGVIEMFGRSIEWFGMKYKKYVDDGDYKIFKNLLEADVYNGNPVIKKVNAFYMQGNVCTGVSKKQKILTQLEKAKKQAAKEKEAKKKRKSEGEVEVTQKKTQMEKGCRGWGGYKS